MASSDRGEAVAASPAPYIHEVRVQHFRSFAEPCAVALRPGLNCIVGPNGSGKSTLLDALLFALTQDASTMGARSWGEVAHRARRGPTCVSVRITNPEPTEECPDEEVSLMAYVKGDASRLFKKGGRAATQQSVREALRSLGLDAEHPSFAVRQHSAERPFDAAQFIALLLQASGSARFNAAAK